MAPKTTLVRGLLAGAVGATVLAVWFLAIDTVQARPFYTPGFLANVLSGADVDDPSGALIAVYTLFHYTAFCVVGMAVAWLMSKVGAFSPILLGLVLGFVLFDLVFYLSVAVTGVDVVQELGWPQVLFGNLLAGLAVMGYLQLGAEASAPSWLTALTQHRIVQEGVIVGVIGALSVAFWFLIFDTIRGQFFYTPGALGSALFLGVAHISEVQVSLLTVGGYTIVHFAAFIVVGLAASTIVVQAEKFPPLLLAGLLIFVTSEAFFLGLLAVVGEWLLGALGWIVIGLANLVATLAMAFYLLYAHPKLRAALTQTTLSSEDAEFPSADS
jgi:hypothetical protein